MHDGAWLATWHSAFRPHVPGHGSLHLLLTQARSLGQSVFSTHSGRQPVYGSPKYSGKHTHEPAPLRSLQTAFAPQGDGLQGLRGSSGIGAEKVRLGVGAGLGLPRDLLLDESLLGIGEQPAKGSPVVPGSHEHTGACLMTTQVARGPQEPGQGSLHLSFWQARFPGHSSLIVHSGRQFGARPM